MELSIPIEIINPTNVYFVEKKKNIIVEGDFVKVLYSTDSFEMNGVYIAINFCVMKPSNSSVRLWVEMNHGNTVSRDLELYESGAPFILDSTMDPQNDFSMPSIRGSSINDKLTHVNTESWIQIINKTQQNREYSEYNGGRKHDYALQKRTEEDPLRNTKKYIIFDPNIKENKMTMEKLCNFERELIKRYIEENCPEKTATYILKNQLTTNMIKYHSENKELSRKQNNIERCILKVSGIWETATHVGITMKFTLVG